MLHAEGELCHIQATAHKPLMATFAREDVAGGFPVMRKRAQRQGDVPYLPYVRRQDWQAESESSRGC